MTWPDGTVWDRCDRLPVPHDDPALEWMADMFLDDQPLPAVEPEAKVAELFGPDLKDAA